MLPGAAIVNCELTIVKEAKSTKRIENNLNFIFAKV